MAKCSTGFGWVAVMTTRARAWRHSRVEQLLVCICMDKYIVDCTDKDTAIEKSTRLRTVCSARFSG